MAEMDEEKIKDYLISIVESGLKEVCDAEQRVIFIRRIDAMPADLESIKDTIRKIRMAVRLLIDEDLADDLYEEMMSILPPVNKADDR